MIVSEKETEIFDSGDLKKLKRLTKGESKIDLCTICSPDII